jgi:hypothetical protein
MSDCMNAIYNWYHKQVINSFISQGNKGNKPDGLT